jgi:hypothetical protein
VVEVSQLERALGEENSISDIRRFFEEGARPFEEREFILFWQSLSEEEKLEFKRTQLH